MARERRRTTHDSSNRTPIWIVTSLDTFLSSQMDHWASFAGEKGLSVVHSTYCETNRNSSDGSTWNISESAQLINEKCLLKKLDARIVLIEGAIKLESTTFWHVPHASLIVRYSRRNLGKEVFGKWWAFYWRRFCHAGMTQRFGDFFWEIVVCQLLLRVIAQRGSC